MQFDLLTIGDLGKLDRGRSRHRPRDDKSLYGGIYPFIQTGDVKHAPFYINNYSQTYNEKGLAQSKLWNHGTLCITIAANIADTAILNIKACFPDSILGFIPHKNKSDVRFVKYCFDVYKSTLEAISKGTTQDNLSLDKLRKVKFRIPSYPIQRKIAAVLSAYDDLIENNNRRIAILEKMAEELYREWFVRLRFPGHEKVRIVKGVPEGWEIRRIDEIVNFLSGYSFKSDTYLPSGKHGIVTIKNVQDGFFISECSDYIDVAPSNMNEHCLLKDGDVLMSLTGNVGRVCHVVGKELLLNQRVAKLQPKIKQASQFMYYTFKNRSMIQLIENLSLGSTAQMNLSPIQLGKQKLLTPKDELLSFYEQKTLPMHNKVMALLKKNALLQLTRDRLLSRLMSGKIDVERLDIKFPASMMEEGNA